MLKLGFLSLSNVVVSSGLNVDPTALLTTQNTFPALGTLQSTSFPFFGGGDGSMVSDASFGGTAAVSDPSALGVVASNGSYSFTLNTKTGSGGYLGFGNFALASKSVTLAFIASIADGNVSTDAIYVGWPLTDQIMQVATLGDQLPGSGQLYSAFGSVDVALDAKGSLYHVVYQAVAGANSSTQVKGIMRSEVDIDLGTSSTSLMVDYKTLIPGSSSAYFTCLSAPTVNAQGTVAFFGSYCGGLTASASVQAQAAAAGYVASTNWQSHCLKRSTDGVAQLPGIYAADSEGVYVIANKGMAVPRGQSMEVFMAFSTPVIRDTGVVAFVALGNVSTKGIFLHFPNGTLQNIISTVDLPGTDFPELPSVGDNGKVVFLTISNSGNYAISSWQAGVVSILLTQNDTVGGQAITYIGMANNAYDSATDAYAAYLVLKNGTYGVWRFSASAAMSGPNAV